MPKSFRKETAAQTPMAAKKPKATALNMNNAMAIKIFLHMSAVIKVFPRNL